MTGEQGPSVLIVATRPLTRGQVAGLILIFGVMMALCLVVAVDVFLQEWPKGSAHALAAATVGAILVGAWPVIAVFAVRENPRGTWRLDTDGIVYRSDAGAEVAARWKEIEWVRWGRCAALQGAGATLRIPFDLIDEPTRSELRARLEAILGPDFDLAMRPMPDPLNAVEPGWWNLTLRAARVLGFGLAIAAAVLGSFTWVALHHPEAGAWQASAVLFGWYALLLGWLWKYMLAFRKLNPEWRRRLHKVPVDALGEPL